MKTMRVVVRGRVQGVWFRTWTESEARARGIQGWVRNRGDGAVEALFHGADAAVDAMVAICRQGPPAARVDSLEAVPAQPPAEAGFRVAPNA